MTLLVLAVTLSRVHADCVGDARVAPADWVYGGGGYSGWYSCDHGTGYNSYGYGYGCNVTKGPYYDQQQEALRAFYHATSGWCGSTTNWLDDSGVLEPLPEGVEAQSIYLRCLYWALDSCWPSGCVIPICSAQRGVTADQRA